MKEPAFVRVRSVRAALRAAIVIGTCAALLVAMTVPAMARQSRYMVTKLVSDTSAIAAGAHVNQRKPLVGDAVKQPVAGRVRTVEERLAHLRHAHELERPLRPLQV